MDNTTNYESFYSGSYSSLSPEYGNFIGYRFPAARLSSTTSIQSANQLNEVVSRLKEGVKNVEIQQINPDTFDQIPKQQFAEIAALAKLSGVKPSIHAPIIDPAGFDQQKGYLGEFGREDSERRLKEVVEKAHELDEKGNIPVVIHSSGGIPGTEFRPGEAGESRFKEQKLIMINPDTKEMKQVEEESKAHPLFPKELEKGKLFTARDRIISHNESEWDQSLTNLSFYKK